MALGQRLKRLAKRPLNPAMGAEERFLVDLPMRIFGTIFTASFTLTDRTVMKYPALLGRTFLREGFLVDVRRKDVSKNKASSAMNLLILSANRNLYSTRRLVTAAEERGHTVKVMNVRKSYAVLAKWANWTSTTAITRLKT